MATRTSLLANLRLRLSEPTAVIWTDAELKAYLDFGIRNLYPSYFTYNIATTTAAGDGPTHSVPSGAKNLYKVGIIKANATRVRPIRGWSEGLTTAVVPKLGITGQTLVWSWTAGFDAAEADGTTLTIPIQAEECVVLRAQIIALEKVLATRTKAEKYFAVQVREGVTEEDVLNTIDALHASLKEALDRGMKLPEIVQ